MYRRANQVLLEELEARHLAGANLRLAFLAEWQRRENACVDAHEARHVLDAGTPGINYEFTAALSRVIFGGDPAAARRRCAMRRLLASVMVVVAVAGATASAARTKAPSGGWWIVLESDRDGSARGYGMRPDGSRLSPILAGASTPSPLAVSDDGGTIAYTGSFESWLPCSS